MPTSQRFQEDLSHTVAAQRHSCYYLYWPCPGDRENFWSSCGAHSLTHSLIYLTNTPDHLPHARHSSWTGNLVMKKAIFS